MLTMNQPDMLTQMCQTELSTADIKTICKNRNFPQKAASSRSIFENYFLTEIGVETALQSLKPEERILLHFITQEKEAVDLKFFACLYPKKQEYGSFTQKYTPVFKAVQSNLVRKGLLLMGVRKTWGKETKTERWQFIFPKEFNKCLPSILEQSSSLSVRGNYKDAILRNKILVLAQSNQTVSDEDSQDHITIIKGKLLIGTRLFTTEHFKEGPIKQWQKLIVFPKQEQRKQAANKPIHLEDLEAMTIEKKEITSVLSDAFSQLAPNAWVEAKEIEPLLKVFYYGTTPPQSIHVCEVGWKAGCLKKYNQGDKTYYRPPDELAASEIDPADYLTVESDRSIRIDLKKIPYESLELLASIAHFEVVGSRLITYPDLICMGQASETTQQHSLIEWLKNSSPAFSEAFATMKKRLGKIIIHDDLLIAKVTDLSLKVQIQKALPQSTPVVLLSNDFIAFPKGYLADVQRIVMKSGYAIKTVKAPFLNDH
ncbi:MAG: hypothetical protein HQM14_12975 [SAR324 cluster bacterium]|nr:hypothetical protein [SAR324 cluster bacterium]